MTYPSASFPLFALEASVAFLIFLKSSIFMKGRLIRILNNNIQSRFAASPQIPGLGSPKWPPLPWACSCSRGSFLSLSFLSDSFPGYPRDKSVNFFFFFFCGGRWAQG